jgi:two-component sensor histidine kinase
MGTADGRVLIDAALTMRRAVEDNARLGLAAAAVHAGELALRPLVVHPSLTGCGGLWSVDISPAVRRRKSHLHCTPMRRSVTVVPLMVVLSRQTNNSFGPGEHIMRLLTSERSLPEERLLMHELTHRINNEYASAISVVSLVAARSGNQEVRVALTGVTELLHHYADVHRALQMPVHRTRIDAGKYLQQLCLSISRAKLDSMKIKLVLTARPLSMQSDRCWRLGMIVYELITNAARHAFDGRNGEIRVELLRSGYLVECRVMDNGSAPENVRPGRGFKIIEGLVEGLDGRFEQEFGVEGSTSTLVFPL